MDLNDKIWNSWKLEKYANLHTALWDEIVFDTYLHLMAKNAGIVQPSKNER